MTTVALRAPAGVLGSVSGPGANYTIAADGTAQVDSSLVTALLAAGWTFDRAGTGRVLIPTPLAADLVRNVAAASAVNSTLVVAAQPDVPRKLQVRLVRTSGDMTAGVLTLVGTDAQGDAVTEVVSLITAGASKTITTANAFAQIASAVVSGVLGTHSYTIGIGGATALGLPLPSNFIDLAVFKTTKRSHDAVSALPTTVDEAVGTVDVVAGTLVPTTVPDGLTDYDVSFAYAA